MYRVLAFFIQTWVPVLAYSLFRCGVLGIRECVLDLVASITQAVLHVLSSILNSLASITSSVLQGTTQRERNNDVRLVQLLPLQDVHHEHTIHQYRQRRLAAARM